MFTVVSEELQAVRDALRTDSCNLGVGIVHLPTGRIALKPFESLRHRGGHVGLAAEMEWSPEECLGFMVARPSAECIMINRSQLNAQAGALHMPAETFRNVLSRLRNSWTGLAGCGTSLG